jgi:hypothetical protein
LVVADIGGTHLVMGPELTVMMPLGWTGSLMLMLLGWVGMWSTHHPVLVRNTIRWDSHSLLLLALLVSTDGVIRNDGIAHEFLKIPVSIESKVHLQLGR